MLLVSIHDVTPALGSGVLRLWDLCSREGITPALFVVPEWHGAWPLEHHPGFVAWLRDRAAEGAELVLHGERHDEVGSTRSLEDLRAWNVDAKGMTGKTSNRVRGGFAGTRTCRMLPGTTSPVSDVSRI